MHELSISSAIVDTALRHASGRRVTGVDVRVGSLRQVVPESLGFYFEIVARDTLCEGAALRLDVVAAALECPRCGCEWDPAPPPLESGASTAARLGYASLGHDPLTPAIPAFRCAECGVPGQVRRGDELEVESIEVAEKEEQCIAPR